MINTVWKITFFSFFLVFRNSNCFYHTTFMQKHSKEQYHPLHTKSKAICIRGWSFSKLYLLAYHLRKSHYWILIDKLFIIWLMILLSEPMKGKEIFYFLILDRKVWWPHKVENLRASETSIKTWMIMICLYT